jgi:hypothetical protein
VTAKVHRLRPKRHDVITEALQLVLDLPLGLGNQTRDELDHDVAITRLPQFFASGCFGHRGTP